MTKMTKKEALTIALNSIQNDTAKTVIEGMIAQLSKPRSISDEARQKRNEKNRATTAAKRAEAVKDVIPVLRKYLTAEMTAKSLYEVAAPELPADFSAAKVQNVLIREMKDEVTRIENGRNACTYKMA